jgi:hypothetical protein
MLIRMADILRVLDNGRRDSDWLRAGRQRSRSSSPGRVKYLPFSTSSKLALGFNQPPVQMLARDFSPGVKRPGHEADHSPPTSARSIKCGSIHPLPHTHSWRSS